MKEKNHDFVRALVESAILIAIGVVLSLLKIVELPQGGSITLASMLPIILISYRHGIGWGLISGVTFSIIQALLGAKNFGYVTGWVSVLAVAVLDYGLAFSLSGLAGIFRKPVKDQALALTFGALMSAVLRFICHVVVGFTVWRDISIPSEAALIYSLGYNATYMIPETIILVMVAFYLGSVLDFRQKELRVIQQQSSVKKNVFVWVGGILITFAVIFAAVVVFSKLQNPETGDFMITGLKDVNWLLVGLVSGISIAAGVAALVAGVVDRRSDSDNA